MKKIIAVASCYAVVLSAIFYTRNWPRTFTLNLPATFYPSARAKFIGVRPRRGTLVIVEYY